MRYAIPLVPLLALLLAACNGGGGEEPTPTSSPAVILPSPTPEPTAEPTATPEVERKQRLIFLRLGVIHMSDLNGSNVIQLTPGDVQASFVGLAEGEGTAILYYISAGHTGNVFTLKARDLSTGETTTLASIEASDAPPSGSLSPDGRYIVIAHDLDIDLLEVAARERRHLLTSNLAGCENWPSSDCYGYNGFGVPAWSPDGRLLFATRGRPGTSGWGGIVVDPFREPVQELRAALRRGAWSPDSDALCGYEQAGYGGGGLNIVRAPDWQSTDLDLLNLLKLGSASSCVWLDEKRIAFASNLCAVNPAIPDACDIERKSDITVFDIESGDASKIATINETEGLERISPRLLQVPGGEFVISQFFAGGDTHLELIRISNGDREPILQPDNSVVAVTQPIALPEEIVPATPEVKTCVPLRAGCEAQVTNVAPQRLNLRDGPPSTLSEVTGKLSEGDIVCLTGSSILADGFRWWPLHPLLEEGRWVAQGDSEEPDRPWLTPTGRECEQ